MDMFKEVANSLLLGGLTPDADKRNLVWKSATVATGPHPDCCSEWGDVAVSARNLPFEAETRLIIRIALSF